MEYLKRLQKWVETVDKYYGLALTLYAAALYIAGNSELFIWVFIITTPFLAGWTGYLLKSSLEKRNERHGFRLISDVVSYEIGSNHKYISRSATTVQACNDHLMVFPIGYQWTGSGEEKLPRITGAGQQLLAPFELDQKDNPRITPYKIISTEGEWRYCFIGLNPPVHKGDIIEIKYAQEFHDKKGLAKPYLYYFVRVPMKQLELNVKFPKDMLPGSITASYIKPSDSSRPYIKTNVVRYDPDKEWATWVIEKPKKGYCYRLHWQ